MLGKICLLPSALALKLNPSSGESLMQTQEKSASCPCPDQCGGGASVAQLVGEYDITGQDTCANEQLLNPVVTTGYPFWGGVNLLQKKASLESTKKEIPVWIEKINQNQAVRITRGDTVDQISLIMPLQFDVLPFGRDGSYGRREALLETKRGTPGPWMFPTFYQFQPSTCRPGALATDFLPNSGQGMSPASGTSYWCESRNQIKLPYLDKVVEALDDDSFIEKGKVPTPLDAKLNANSGFTPANPEFGALSEYVVSTGPCGHVYVSFPQVQLDGGPAAGFPAGAGWKSYNSCTITLSKRNPWGNCGCAQDCCANGW
jgi:hypothetical protein